MKYSTDIQGKRSGGQKASIIFPLSASVDAAQVSDGVSQIVDEHGRLDILVNNAGLSVDALLTRLAAASFNR